ncbi:MAG TPA: murein biosynthesis integral membrane protein MurJ [Pontiella sp.]
MKDRKVIQAAGVVGSFTLLSRGLGMIRDIIIAYHFGTSMLASAFFVAFTIPNLFRRLFGEGALSAAFIPVFVETRTKQGDQEAWKMASKVVTMTAALLSAIAIIGVLLFSVGTKMPGISEKWITTFSLSRVMFPYVLFICLAALFMAILNSFKHFSISAFAPCLLNLILIITMLGVFPMIGNKPLQHAYALSWAVVIAGIAQVTIQLPALSRFGCPFKFTSHWTDPRIRKMLLLMGPASLGMAVTQFNVLIDRLLALWIGPWAPAALFYSERMIYFPLGIIATALGTVLLPTFSVHVAKEDHSSMSKTITSSLRHLIFIMVPAALGLLVLATDILTALFEWNGSFDANSTRLSSRALMFYAPGLIVFSVAKVFVPAFYALQDTKTPVRIGIYTVLLNLILNITFILTLPEYWKHVGMAFSTVLAETIGMAALGLLLARRIPDIQWKVVLRGFVRCLACGIIMAAAAGLTAHYALPALKTIYLDKVAQLMNLVLSIGAGAGTYFILSLGLNSPELSEIRTALRRK